ncbi:MAG: chloride channel protein [Candidatus Eisenbacteria bacterium]|uniref:Chloride channel protein n=1 Tax=Eiseniibacteriota bacterium TaxID=2212470 RepID=A0A948RWQ4_UNCEI|nr:chloride channel protein [Candidatus Eisenbacteria bacterium]MBU1950518.1 chloride channel protein [Candidatus Eisenbacteria bacterium]MBU2690947.1 chloride channel protein [Candidatus Eisenbacteria bacterium]
MDFHQTDKLKLTLPTGIVGFLRRPVLSPNTLILILSLVIGIATGLGAVLFRLMITEVEAILTPISQALSGSIGWLPPTIGLVLAALVVGPIIHFFSSEAKGHGVPEVMAAVALEGGRIRRRVAVAKIIASALCIGSGGSAGREGPIVQIGSAIGSAVGQFSKMSNRRMRVLVACGAAGGISAVFNAPIAGVMFSVEIILGDFAIESLTPVVLSSVLASVTTGFFMAGKSAFQVPPYELVSAYEIPLYILLGVVGGAMSVFYTRVLYLVEDFFDGLKKIPFYFRPALGALGLGLLAIAFPQILADGYHGISDALMGRLPWTLLLLLPFMKILATSLTLGSGNSGGVFAPSLFIGAMVGGAFGVGAHTLWPAVTAHPGAYALVGMATLVAGATHAPITAILIIFEMTNDYRIILPLMIAAAISTFISSRIFKESIYTLKLSRRGINIRQGREVNVLTSVKVHEVMEPPRALIPSTMPLTEVLDRVTQARGSVYPVVDKSERLTGVISLTDLREVLRESWGEHTRLLIIAQDVATVDPVTITPGENLNDAMKKFGKWDMAEIPVVDPDHDGRLVGMVRRSEVISAYNRALLSEERGS